ncbi:MAG: penicillin-binding protein 1A [Bdellovibrionales bacterium]
MASLRAKILVLFGVLMVVGAAGIAVLVSHLNSELPELIGLAQYKPLLVSEVFDRNGKKFGEFFREKRILTPYEEIPDHLVKAFVAAEDDTFFEHDGINLMAITRAMIANIKSGKKSQGGSTITQQVARSLLLSSEKTYTRKIKEIILSRKMEQTLGKKDIMYLYLNQIYLGQGAHGVGAAAEIYFRKNVKDLTIPEAAILAGLPQAPSRYSPIHNPSAAKDRQRYVLRRMADVGFITDEQSEQFINEPVKLYVWQNFKEMAPYYLETVRQMLVSEVGEDQVLDKGIKIYTGMDLEKQVTAQNELQNGLRELDKRQGFRGPKENIIDPEKVAEFLLKSRDKMMDEASPERLLKPDGTFDARGPLNLTGKNEKGEKLPVLSDYLTIGKIVDAVVTKVDDKAGLVYVRFAENKGLIDISTMKWARKPDMNVRSEYAEIKKPSEALKVGDVIQVKIGGKDSKTERLTDLLNGLEADKDNPKKKNKVKTPKDLELPPFEDYAAVELEQDPLVEGALVSIDERSQDLLALVGGYDFSRSKFNRALQAARQTGSAFKALVYLAALDKDYTPATPIIDAPIVFDEVVDEGQDEKGGSDGEPETKTWRPKNHGNKFSGDILFRNALIHSLNIPTVKIIEKIGVEYAATYARRLGIFSPLNMDFTLALGSSGITLYEMTRAFGIIGRLGQRLSPILIKKVVDANGQEIATNISLDQRFKTEISRIEDDFEQRRQAFLKNQENSKEPSIFFSDRDQLIRPATAYVLTTILQGVIDEAGGTGGAARSLGRPVAGKTGTTNGYYDGWFIGFTPDIASGVWVGFDEEKSIGKGEVGGKAALPIWLNYMKEAHDGLSPRGFSVPDGVSFANIDNETGRLVSSTSKSVVRQAFIDGTEPGSSSAAGKEDDDTSFYKEDAE